MVQACDGSDIHVFAMDLLDFPYPESKYSLVVASAILHFLRPTDLWWLADRLVAALAVGGLLIVEVMTTDDPGYDASMEDGTPQIQPNTFKAPEPIQLIHYFESNELARIFHGLRVLFYEESRRIDPRDPVGFRSGASLVARRD